MYTMFDIISEVSYLKYDKYIPVAVFNFESRQS